MCVSLWPCDEFGAATVLVPLFPYEPSSKYTLPRAHPHPSSPFLLSLSLSQSLVPKYFQYIQLVEQTATKVANANAIKNWVLDAVSIGLDLLGLLEPIGIVFDLINVGLAFLRGLWMDGYVRCSVHTRSVLR